MDATVTIKVEGKQTALTDLFEIEDAASRAADQLDRLARAAAKAWSGNASAERIHGAVAAEPVGPRWRVEIIDRECKVARGFVVNEKPEVSSEDGLIGIRAGELVVHLNPREFSYLVVEQTHAPATSA